MNQNDRDEMLHRIDKTVAVISKRVDFIEEQMKKKPTDWAAVAKIAAIATPIVGGVVWRAIQVLG